MKVKEQDIIHESFNLKPSAHTDHFTNKVFENWGKHHCMHCEHASMFPVAVTDLGSLKLKDILRFQQDGRCCKSFCEYCRKTHQCEFQREVSIIDYEKGAITSDLLKVTPRPFDIELKNLTGQNFFKKGNFGVEDQ